MINFVEESKKDMATIKIELRKKYLNLSRKISGTKMTTVSAMEYYKFYDRCRFLDN
jgi:hypothetical protein